jgi:hypothetical protein
MKRLLIIPVAAVIAVSLLLGCGGKEGVKRTSEKIKKDTKQLYKDIRKDIKKSVK